MQTSTELRQREKRISLKSNMSNALSGTFGGSNPSTGQRVKESRFGKGTASTLNERDLKTVMKTSNSRRTNNLLGQNASSKLYQSTSVKTISGILSHSGQKEERKNKPRNSVAFKPVENRNSTAVMATNAALNGIVEANDDTAVVSAERTVTSPGGESSDLVTLDEQRSSRAARENQVYSNLTVSDQMKPLTRDRAFSGQLKPLQNAMSPVNSDVINKKHTNQVVGFIQSIDSSGRD